jgi:hypothetical protein
MPNILRIHTSPEPIDYYGLDRYAAIVNVSDTSGLLFQKYQSPPQFLLLSHYFWFPINEVGDWGYAPFFGAAKVCDFYGRLDKPILIHCHAGVNRSPCVAYALLRAEGLSDAEITAQLSRSDLPNDFQINVRRGCIPADIITFLETQKQHPKSNMMGILNRINSPKLFTPFFKNLEALNATIKDTKP